MTFAAVPAPLPNEGIGAAAKPPEFTLRTARFVAALALDIGWRRRGRRHPDEATSASMLSRPSEASTSPSLRDAMRQLAGGVSIITVGAGANRAGFTASSVTSLTLDPPCVLVCINRKVSAWPLIRDERRFCVNVVAEEHRALASRFAGIGGIRGLARFEQGSWRDGANGTPILTDALASIECDLEDAIERHSHMIMIGAVRGIHVAPGGSALLYSQGGFGRFEPL